MSGDYDEQAIISDLKKGELQQTEIAEKHDVSDATVSRIKSAWKNGRMEGAKDMAKRSFDFKESDDTNTKDEDTYYCGYCRNDGVETEIEYLQDTCPSCGADLSGDW